MSIRLLACGAGNTHLIGPCPNCYVSQGGLLVGTIPDTHKGRVIATCLDCGSMADYYVDAKAEQIWKLEPVESKGSTPVTSPFTNKQ